MVSVWHISTSHSIGGWTERRLGTAITHSIRECVRRHSRLPRIIITDNGREFHCKYFEALLAKYNVDRKFRPPEQARFGSVCERLFGTTNTEFIHNLLGNTKIMKNVRQVTKAYNPKTLSVWTLADLDEMLREYVYNVYDNEIHPALGMSPREARKLGAAQHGEREITYIKYDRDFEISTLPITRNGTAKVQPGKGVKVFYMYYFSQAFRDPKVEKQKVPIRYDPLDITKVYAFVNGNWVECLCEYYMELRGTP